MTSLFQMLALGGKMNHFQSLINKERMNEQIYIFPLYILFSTFLCEDTIKISLTFPKGLVKFRISSRLSPVSGKLEIITTHISSGSWKNRNGKSESGRAEYSPGSFPSSGPTRNPVSLSPGIFSGCCKTAQSCLMHKINLIIIFF